MACATRSASTSAPAPTSCGWATLAGTPGRRSTGSASIGDAVVENFGWPCYEGAGRQSGYDSTNLPICEGLYQAAGVTAPAYTYNHNASVVSGDGCPTGGSSTAGIAFYPESGGTFPAAYRGGLFFADYTRNCIWWMAKGANGQPDPATRAVFVSPAAGPVDLEVGPDGALYYVGFNGTIRRVQFTSGNQPPTASADAAPTSGPAPLTVSFDGRNSTDPESGTLTYAWDLDGDGAFDDATGATATWTYSSPATVTARLRVTDPGGLTGTDSVVISASNTPPVPVIDTPAAGMTWEVGEEIFFSGSASDAQDGSIPVSGLSWQVTIRHCPSNCHSHPGESFPGVASESFFGPDHEYPAHLELTLTATDAQGASASTTRELHPETVLLSFATAPSGLQLAVNATASTAPFTREVIKGSLNSAVGNLSADHWLDYIPVHRLVGRRRRLAHDHRRRGGHVYRHLCRYGQHRRRSSRSRTRRSARTNRPRTSGRCPRSRSETGRCAATCGSTSRP